MRPLTRINPHGEVYDYKTYAISSPHDRTVKTACEDAGCLAWRYGWETTVDESSDLGKAQARYIRRSSGRTFRESRSGALTVFRFESGQRCFSNHRTRPEVFFTRDGDWRGNPTGRKTVHTRPEFWVEDFAENQQAVADRIEKG